MVTLPSAPRLPDQIYLRRGHICAHYGLSSEEFADLVAVGVFVPRYLPLPAPDKLPLFRQRRLPKVKRAVFLRAEVISAERAGRIAAAAVA